MPSIDKEIVKKDKKPGMTTEEKNAALGQLLLTTQNDKNIVRIDRLEIEVQGWRIVYR